MTSVITKIYVKATLSYYWKFEGLIDGLSLSVKSVEKIGVFKTTNITYDFIVELEISDEFKSFAESENFSKYTKNEFKHSLAEFVKDLESYIRLQKKLQSKGL